MNTKMDRLAVLRLGGIAGAAAFVGGKYLGEPAPAWAMTSRFDSTLTLTNGIVRATGPSGLASDETRARIFAFVAQAGRVQTGQTGWLDASDVSWSAVLSGPALKKGAADAFALALVQNRDGTYEWYPWETLVTLR